MPSALIGTLCSARTHSHVTLSQLSDSVVQLTCLYRIGPPTLLARLTFELVEEILVRSARHTNPTAFDAVTLYFLFSGNL